MSYSSLRETLLQTFVPTRIQFGAQTILTHNKYRTTTWSFAGEQKTFISMLHGHSRAQLVNDSIFSFRSTFGTYIHCAETGRQLSYADKDLFCCKDFYLWHESRGPADLLYSITSDFGVGEKVYSLRRDSSYYRCGNWLIAVESYSRYWCRGTVFSHGIRKNIFNNEPTTKMHALSDNMLLVDNERAWYFLSADNMTLHNYRNRREIGFYEGLVMRDDQIVDIHNPTWNQITYCLFNKLREQHDFDMLLSLSHAQMVNLYADQLGWP